MTNTNRPPRFFIDADGERCASIPLAKPGQFATMYADDLAKLQGSNVPLNWFFNLNGKRTHGNVKVAIPGDNVRNVSRVITGAGRGQQVHYRDRNPMNLRRDNLVIVEGGHATVSPRALLDRQAESSGVADEA